MHEIVANWLWDGGSPEAWDAARRLTAAGVDRHEVLHRLMGVASNSVYGAIQGTAHDPGELRRQLEQLA